MSNAREIAQLGSVPSGRKNLIINGDMIVAQRGTSGGSTSSYSYTLDRWLANGAITSWAQTGSQKNVMQLVTQAGTGIAQRIESNGANFVSGNTYTLSFKINPTVADVEIGVTFRNGSTFLSNVVATTDVSSQVTAGAYSTVTYTFTLPASADIVTYSSHNMQIYIGSSVVNTLNIKEVQLELGSVATVFEHRSYGEELALCQRYYQSWEWVSHWLGIGGVAGSGNVAFWSYSYLNPMRTTPSVTHNGSAPAYYNGTWVTSGSSVAVSVYKDFFNAGVLNVAIGTGTNYLVRWAGGATSRAYFDAEL